MASSSPEPSRANVVELPTDTTTDMTTNMPTKLKRVRSRRGEGAGLRDEILDAVDKLMADAGTADAVSIRAVGDIVGVSAPSIYRHFADKDEMVHDACDRGFERFEAHLRGASNGKTGLEAIHAIALAYLSFAAANPGQYRVLFMTPSPIDMTTHDFSFDTLRTDMTALVHLAELVDAGAKAGDIRQIADPMHMAAMLWTMVHGIASLRIAKPELPWPSIEDQALTLFTMLNGICR
jgi:AcrR family transcriptional regulator